VIWEKFQQMLEPLREGLNRAMGKSWEEWQVPREAEDPWDADMQELFHALRAEQARGEQGSHKKIDDALAAINHNLKRRYALGTLPDRSADPWPEPARKLHPEW
jgi:adenine-specific DNA-methyltransferase